MNSNVAPYRIRLAEANDIELIMSLLDEVITWLADLGLDQWQGNRARQRQHVATDIGEESLFVVEKLGKVVATITIDEQADADFWRHKDNPLSALYVHRMAVAPAEAGIGLGSAMLDWAAEQVERRDRALLRLDAWSTNDKLHQYYKQLGFRLLRNHPVEGRGSGALFERPATERCGRGPVLDKHLVDKSADGGAYSHLETAAPFGIRRTCTWEVGPQGTAVS